MASKDDYVRTGMSALDTFEVESDEVRVAFCARYGSHMVDVIILFLVADGSHYRLGGSALPPGSMYVADFGAAWKRCLSFIEINSLEPA